MAGLYIRDAMISNLKSALIARVPPQNGQYTPKKMCEGQSVIFAKGVPETDLANHTRNNAANIKEKLIVMKNINLFLRFIKVKFLSRY